MGYGDHIRGRVLLWFPSVHRASPTAHNIAIILKVAAIFAGHLNKGKKSRFCRFWNCNSDFDGSVRVITVKPGQAYPPRFHNEFIIRKLNPLVVVDFRIIYAFLMRREFTREAVAKFLPAKVPWIWCKCLSQKLNPFKDFQSDQIQRSSRTILTAWLLRLQECRFKFVASYRNEQLIHFSKYQLINRIFGGGGVRLTCLDCKVLVLKLVPVGFV